MLSKPSLHPLLAYLSSSSFPQFVQNMVEYFCSWDEMCFPPDDKALPESLQLIAQNLTFHADASKQLFRTVII